MLNPLFQSPDNWPVIDDVDVLVVGAGPGGFPAAVAAARMGLKTLVVEKYGSPGGTATMSSCAYLMGWCREGKVLVAGIGDELVRRLDALGQARFRAGDAAAVDGRPIGDRPLRAEVVVSIDGMRVAINRMLEEAGVSRLYYTSTIGAVTEGDRITAVAVDRLEGPALIKAKIFIDATGDAHLVHRAGGEVREASVEESMTKTILHSVGGLGQYHRRLATGFYKSMLEEGKVPYPEQTNLMASNGLHPGEGTCNFTLVRGNGLTSSDMTRMDVEMREQLLVAEEFFRANVPGFRDTWIANSAAHVGVRCGRSIVGLETITQHDIDENTPVAEAVTFGTRSYGDHGLSKFTSDWGKHQAGLRGVPWKTLIPKSFTNVLASGRAISCEPKVITTFRLMSRCMAVGHAAGVTAALAAAGDGNVHALTYEPVKAELKKQGAIVELG